MAKETNKVKQPRSAWVRRPSSAPLTLQLFFSMEERARITEEKGEGKTNGKTVMKTLGNRWKEVRPIESSF